MDIEIIREMGKAVAQGNLEVVKELLAANEGLLEEDCWLHDAATYGQYEIAKYLLECGIDVNNKGPFEEKGAIACAAFKGQLDIVKLLHDNGAEFDISDATCNPLFRAIYNGHSEVVEYLVEQGIDLTASYKIGQHDNMDAYEYAKLYGQTQIAEYLKEQMGSSQTEKSAQNSSTKEVAWDGNLDKQHFIDLFKAAVQDIYPQIKEKYQEESIYGLAFEIANTVCMVYAEDFATNIYLNTEERYQEAIEDCDEEEQGYYRFSAWAEWISESADTEHFRQLQEYLQANCPTDDEDEDEDEDGAIEQIRRWQAEALGQLRAEGFWEKQGNPDIWVIPFEGEDEISVEELAETYKEMDRGYHGEEYLMYLEGK